MPILHPFFVVKIIADRKIYTAKICNKCIKTGNLVTFVKNAQNPESILEFFYIKTILNL